MTGFEGDVCLVDKCNTCIKDNNKKNWIDILDEEYFLSYLLRDLLKTHKSPIKYKIKYGRVGLSV